VNCVFEEQHGRPCLLCRGGTAAPEAVGVDHLEAAEAADRLAASQLFGERGLFLHPIEVAGLTANERLVLDAWAVGDQPLGAVFATRAHVAAAVAHVPDHGDPGDVLDAAAIGTRPVQPCTRCGLVLQDHAAVVEDGAYPVGAHVGLDCEGTPRTEAA